MLAQQEIQDLNIHLEQKVAKRTEELEIANKELEAFSYTVSHDLRAPLRAIHGFANIIDEDFNRKLDPEILRLLGLVKDNAKQMGQLIDDLLDFSRLGKKDIQKRFVDMQSEVEKAIKEVTTGIDHHAEFVVEPLMPALADSALLNRVLFNLISNALKYSSKKENPLIKIYCVPHNHYVEYVIQDNGAGFDMEYVSKLFGVFQRLHSASDFSGTGVGLAIVERIIKKHGGMVWAEGKVGDGAVFHFTLPALL
jgi:light-regulated signal transduction histidine kinase (bacteriophytochrome)